ncbi:MAG: hypothetical protein DRJ03_29855 [Chloroflexi bacterium]|nr:MAG: hypothetical protein DRJ03_29855 [Chloroflexota bacterium]
MDIEELYNLLRTERKTRSIQPFPENEIKQYLSELKTLQRELLADERMWKERRRVEDELETAEFCVREIIRLRAIKVTHHAIFTSLVCDVSDSPLVLKNMTEEEGEIFWRLCEGLKKIYEKVMREL